MLVVLSVAYVMLVGLFVCSYEGDCFCCNYAVRGFCNSYASQYFKISAVNMWVTIFIEIMQVGVSVAIVQVVFSTVHYAHDYICCNYANYAVISVVAMYVTASSSKSIFLSLTDIHFSQN